MSGSTPWRRTIDTGAPCYACMLGGDDGLTLFMSTIGATFILEGAAQLIFGSDVYPLKLYPTDAWFALESIFPGGILINKLDVWGGVIAGILVVGLAVFFQRTKTGRALRAVADDHAAAQSVGIPISWNLRELDPAFKMKKFMENKSGKPLEAKELARMKTARRKLLRRLLSVA